MSTGVEDRVVFLRCSQQCFEDQLVELTEKEQRLSQQLESVKQFVT